jgi:arsenate reductase
VNQTVTAQPPAVDGTADVRRPIAPGSMAAVPSPASSTGAPAIQVFGRENDQATRAALRFFKERRVPISFVDLRRHPIAPGELRRFVERLGAVACADTDGQAWRDAGLAYLRMTDAELAAKLLADVRLLRLPLVRHGREVTAGRAESTWQGWLAASRGPAIPP